MNKDDAPIDNLLTNYSYKLREDVENHYFKSITIKMEMVHLVITGLFLE